MIFPQTKLPPPVPKDMAESRNPGREEDLIQRADHYNQGTRFRHLLNEIRNSFYNHSKIIQAFGEGRAFDLSEAPKVKNKPIIQVGSGPTFDDSIDELKKWHAAGGAIMCSTSQITTLIYHGIEPDYCIALDPRSSGQETIIESWTGKKTAMVLHPGVENSLVEYWPNKMYFFRKRQNETAFYSNAQLVGYSTQPMDKDPNNANDMFDIIKSSNILIKTEIVMLSCVINCQFFVAKMLGYGPQYLVGLDMSYPDDRMRFRAWTYSINGQWEQAPLQKYSEAIKADAGVKERELISKEGVPTDRVQIFFKRNVMTAWRLELADIINTYPHKEKGVEGVLRELPSAWLPDVVKSEGKFTRKVKSFNNKKKIDASEQYMAGQDTYCIPFKQGFRFVEAPNPEKELVIFLQKALAANAPFLDDWPPDRIMERVMKLRPDKFPNGKTWDFTKNVFKEKSEMVAASKKILDHVVEPTEEAFNEMLKKWTDFYGEPMKKAISQLNV